MDMIHKQNEYVTLLNHIRTESKILIADKRADGALAAYENSLINTFERIESHCPDFCTRFVREDLRSVEFYNQYETTQKIM